MPKAVGKPRFQDSPSINNGDRQCLRHASFHGENWNAPARISDAPASRVAERLAAADRMACAAQVKPTVKASTPKASHAAKYPRPSRNVARPGRRSPADRTTRL